MVDANLCECGCETPCAKRFVAGHNGRIKPDDPKELELRSLVLAFWAERLSARETAEALGVSEGTVWGRRAALGLKQEPCGICGVPTVDPDNLCWRCLHWKKAIAGRRVDPRENYIPTGGAREILEVLDSLSGECASTGRLQHLLSKPWRIRRLQSLQRRGLVESPIRGEWCITGDGRYVLSLARAPDHEPGEEREVLAYG